jgi:ParB-like chromosome segregation protein Spo0J
MSGYQVMPRLSPEEYADLEQSIELDGVLVPIIVSPGGEIIDGHHRAEIARRLGLHCPEVVKHGDPAELRTFAYSLNLNRRHLSREQRRELVAQSLKQDPQLSNREHARRTGVSDKTVSPVRSALEARAEIPHVSTVADSLGRQQPARVQTLADEAADYLAASDASYAEQAKSTVGPEQATSQVLGTDGKTYTAPKPAAPRRRPLPEQFWQAAYDLTKVTERIERLADDDRFPTNADQVAAANRIDLTRAVDALQGVVNRLPAA